MQPNEKEKHWLSYRKADKYIRNYILANKWLSGDEKPQPLFSYLYWRNVKVQVCKDGTLSKTFTKDGVNLIPIILSHGLTASRTRYTAICQELASHGYIVFALDHHDGSCPYTEDRTGEKYWCFDTDAPSLKGDLQKSYEDMHGKVITRETEIRCLIDDISHPAFCYKALKFKQ